MTHRLLYLSGYLEAHRQEYYDRLQAVRERGEIQEWLQFFLTAVRRQAEDAVFRAGALIDLRERYIDEAALSRSNISGLVNLFFSNPYVTVRRVEKAMGITNAGARNLVRAAEHRGWLVELGTSGRGGRTFWLANEIFDIIEAPPRYPDSD